MRGRIFTSGFGWGMFNWAYPLWISSTAVVINILADGIGCSAD